MYLGSGLGTDVNQGREKKLFPRQRSQHGSRAHAMKEHCGRQEESGEGEARLGRPEGRVQQGLLSFQDLASELTLFSASSAPSFTWGSGSSL